MRHSGLNYDGTFAEYFRNRSDRLLVVPEEIDPCLASLLEPVSVCLEAVRRGRIGRNDRVLVVGDGPFGILSARLAATRTATKIIVIGRHDFRLRYMPTAWTIHENRTGDTERTIRELSGGEGVDVAILCTGSAEAVRLGLASLRARGRLVLFSAVVRPVPLDLFRVHVQELEILGACNDEDLRAEALALLTDAALGLGELITHRLPFREWRRALDLAAEGKEEAMKVAMVFGGGG